jgi:hypothetical protein
VTDITSRRLGEVQCTLLAKHDSRAQAGRRERPYPENLVSGINQQRVPPHEAERGSCPPHLDVAYVMENAQKHQVDPRHHTDEREAPHVAVDGAETSLHVGRASDRNQPEFRTISFPTVRSPRLTCLLKSQTAPPPRPNKTPIPSQDSIRLRGGMSLSRLRPARIPVSTRHNN